MPIRREFRGSLDAFGRTNDDLLFGHILHAHDEPLCVPWRWHRWCSSLQPPAQKHSTDHRPRSHCLVVDVELAGGRVQSRSSCHGDGALGIADGAQSRLIFDGAPGFFASHLCIKAAALHHEPRDHTVEQGVFIKSRIDVRQEVPAGDG